MDKQEKSYYNIISVKIWLGEGSGIFRINIMLNATLFPLEPTGSIHMAHLASIFIKALISH